MVLLDGKPVKLFFSRKGKRGNWKTFIGTNTTLSFIQMIEIYNIRWTIEVFFKESKQLFGLGKDQANDFDSQIAATTLSMLQHILITTRYRFENYESKGALFRQAQVEIFNEKI
ncbi:MAG: transposase [Bacteroidales bacterium]|nr:transposase [Bacteroidales bacterium]